MTPQRTRGVVKDSSRERGYAMNAEAMVTVQSALEQSPLKSFQAGQAILEQDAPPSEVYVLHSGQVQVERGKRVIATYDTPGAIFGEVAVLLNEPSQVAFRAVDDVEVRVVDDFHALVQKDVEALYGLAQSLARRLADMDHAFIRTQEQLEEMLVTKPSDTEQTKSLKQRIADAWEQFGEVMRTEIF